MIENLIYAAHAAGQPVAASFYRSAAGAEIDLLLTWPGGRTWAVEIKRSLAPKLEKGFYSACEDVRPEQRFVVYPGPERYPLAGGVEALGLPELAASVQHVAS